MKPVSRLRFSGAALLTVSLLGLAGHARATTVTLNSLNLGQNVAMIVDGQAATEPAYRLNITLNSTISRFAFCIDLFTLINYATYNTTLSSVDTFPNGQRLAWVVENYGIPASTNTAAAATQLVLWDIVHDGGDGFGAGRVQLATSVSTSLRDLANLYLTNSAGRSSLNATVLTNVSLSGNTPAQTLITSPVFENPEPSTFVLLAGGVAGIAIGRFRRRRNPTAQR